MTEENSKTHEPDQPAPTEAVKPSPTVSPATAEAETAEKAEEFGGPSGPDPTRFGDWERKGRCIDF